MKRWIVGLVGVLVAFSSVTQAAVYQQDFSTGPGPNFSVFNEGNLWAVSTSGPNLRISKPADDGTFVPVGWIQAGILSQFVVNGDFTITVDFALYDFPGTLGPDKVNESVLAVTPGNGVVFDILRFIVDNRNRIETYSNPPYAPLTVADTSITSGRYRLTRIESTITGLYAPEDSSSFIPLGSYTYSNFSEPMYVGLLANQGADAGFRSTTAMDIGFDNLIIEADSITGLVPEPSTLILCLLVGIIGIIGWWRRRKSA